MKKIVSVLLVIIWMFVIFIMSSFDSVESANQSNVIVDIIVNIFNISNVSFISLIVRKMGHFIEYFILGLLVCNSLKYFNKKNYFAIIICILYAICDEIHQGFVPGRSPQFYDVLIDSLGSTLGVYLSYFVLKKRNINY